MQVFSTIIFLHKNYPPPFFKRSWIVKFHLQISIHEDYINTNSSIFNKKLDDTTQLILMFEVTDLVGIVSLLYGMLLHSAAPSHRDMDPCELLVRTLAITCALGEEGMWLEFWHMASYLILYSSHHLCEDLLHQVILCLGYFTLLHPDNQVVLQQLCFLPFQYFSESRLTDVGLLCS
ncbi:hypothetical protein ACOMHN_058246 [Nucella lapillus]